MVSKMFRRPSNGDEARSVSSGGGVGVVVVDVGVVLTSLRSVMARGGRGRATSRSSAGGPGRSEFDLALANLDALPNRPLKEKVR